MKKQNSNPVQGEFTEDDCDRLIKFACYHLLAGNVQDDDERGVVVHFTSNRFSLELNDFAMFHFDVYFSPSENLIELRKIDQDKCSQPIAQRALKSRCLELNHRENLQTRIGWLIRAYRDPSNQVCLDWGSTDYLGSVIWYTANGWLKPNCHVKPNSMGGNWHCASITDKGRKHVEDLSEVVFYDDADQTQYAFDAGGWLINHATVADKWPRWIRLSTAPDLVKAKIVRRISAIEFGSVAESGYPQLG